MISKQPASNPTPDVQQGGPQDRGESCGPDHDRRCGTSYDYMDEAIEESMDASDPPALAPQTTIGPPSRGAGDGRAGRD